MQNENCTNQDNDLNTDQANNDPGLGHLGLIHKHEKKRFRTSKDAPIKDQIKNVLQGKTLREIHQLHKEEEEAKLNKKDNK